MATTYRDIKADILARITRGALAPGALIPNELELAETYDCARATVNRAMRELAEEGVIERKRKAGTRVRLAPRREARVPIPIVRHEIEATGARYRYSLLSREETTAPDWLRDRLSLLYGARALHLTCLHFADGAPYQYEDRWISLDMLPHAADADFTATGPNEWLVAAIPFSNAEIAFGAVAADADAAAHLACTEATPLFQTERSTWWQGEAITFVRLWFRPGYRLETRY
ncbi:UTRA domain-containing protein [Roseovarius spongiae]|uniref:UTRA domain-containing protein n=1 Tax=Roseovarius spongiae TaxID=2320272 RepID=A0A3A8BAJ5_9RHOB|nr:UTRA domain-containing protein [Roseovarius spongiae]RKF16184.1 UTRA domain-containing protein [Roseovarius spongiae]